MKKLFDYSLVYFLVIIFLFFTIPSVKSQLQKNDTIKIATWNVQLLPELYSPVSKLLRKKQKIRSPKIIQYLNASKFDVVVLQEVFDKKRAKEFVSNLSITYPYILKPIKNGRSIKLSSGLMILSKYPFELVKHEIFNVSKNSDRWAQKGCSLIKIKINQKSILIAGLHLDSKNEVSRNLQYNLVNEKIIKPYISDSIPFFLAGDFNTDVNSKDYLQMLKLFKLNNFKLKDDRPYTYDEYNSWNPKGYKSWIDFILFNETRKAKVIDQYILRPKMQHEKSSIDLSDHFQIVVEAVIF
tara:strand:- start:497 stop:1387 length:891 start_codon:yes stop_codon:yes gene_type:complete